MSNFKEYIEEQNRLANPMNEKVEWEWRISADGTKEKHYYTTDPRKKIIDDNGVKREVPYTPQEIANRKRAQKSGAKKRKAQETSIEKKRIKSLSKKDGYNTDGSGQINRARELSDKPLESDIKGQEKAKRDRAENSRTQGVANLADIIKNMEQKTKKKIWNG